LRVRELVLDDLPRDLLPLDAELLERPPLVRLLLARLLVDLVLLDRLPPERLLLDLAPPEPLDPAVAFLPPLDRLLFSVLRASSSDRTTSLSLISPRQPSISSSSSLVNVIKCRRKCLSSRRARRP
jgi:hypothetical protein